MIRNLKFKDSRPSDFQCKMSKDIKDMKSSQHLYVPADKTTNLYKISAEQYQHLLHSNITANYRKAGDEAKSSIDREAKDIAEKLTLADRVECFAQRDSFITLKDHKENFPNKPTRKNILATFPPPRGGERFWILKNQGRNKDPGQIFHQYMENKHEKIKKYGKQE